jgi:hypothetical protein
VLGALGKRDAEMGETELSVAECGAVRRQAATVVAQAALIAVVGAGVAWLL